VEILFDDEGTIFVGVARPHLDPNGNYILAESTDGWFIWDHGGGLFGNGKYDDDEIYEDIMEGDRVGVLLDLNEGSLRFFKNGVQQGPGFPAGSVTGPVVCAVYFDAAADNSSVRLLPQDGDHALLQ
jgi:hypothetical protein